jgi:hypothetical protein
VDKKTVLANEIAGFGGLDLFSLDQFDPNYIIFRNVEFFSKNYFFQIKKLL